MTARATTRLDGAEAWRGRIETQLSALSHQVAELATELHVRTEHSEQQHRETLDRLSAIDRAVRGGVDVTITSGNQSLGAEAAKSALPKTAAALGGGGFFGWLFGGDGWSQISGFFKKWLN